MLLITVYAIKVRIVHNKFKRLVSGENITGTIASELSARSKLQCSDRLVEFTGRPKLRQLHEKLHRRLFILESSKYQTKLELDIY